MKSEISADDVLRFWFEEIDQSRWFKADPDFDRQLEKRFGAVLAKARNGDLADWCNTPRGRLALIIVLDQFSRNIHRGTGAAFGNDARALELAVAGIQQGADKLLSLEQRSFFYLPLRHAEDLAMQKLGLAKTRELNAAGYGTDKYALNHLEIIERFGRFPHRNAALGRPSTAAEEAFLAEGKAGF